VLCSGLPIILSFAWLKIMFGVIFITKVRFEVKNLIGRIVFFFNLRLQSLVITKKYMCATFSMAKRVGIFVDIFPGYMFNVKNIFGVCCKISMATQNFQFLEDCPSIFAPFRSH
jgi:hypothetical protein